LLRSTGFRLGDETRPSERVAPKAEAAPTQEANGPLTYTLEFYRQGFTVNKGPLRSYTDPENSTFLADINQGYV
jgi:UBX domain-containing protein 1